MCLKKMLLLLVLIGSEDIFARSRSAKGIGHSDGLFHVAVFGHYSPGGSFAFPNYTEGNTNTNLITAGKANFLADTFSSYGAELMFYSQPISGFSFGYCVDSALDIEHLDVEFANGTTTRTLKNPKDAFENKSAFFNYYLARTPDEGYFSLGVNYSNPTWTFNTATNNNVDLKGGLGFQTSIGLSLLKGFIFDITYRSTAIKMKYTDPTTNNYQDFGSGSLGSLLIGFKFIL